MTLKKNKAKAKQASQDGGPSDRRRSRADVDDALNPPIGERLKERRTQHGLSMRQLADKAGVSASLISDIERGRVEPSISVLKRLSGALDITLMYFFSEATPDDDLVVRANERRVLGTREFSNFQSPTGGIHFELASPEGTETIEAVFGRYEVGATMGDEPVTHEGEEWGMVLTGRLKIWVGDETYFLNPGDSIAFSSTTPHRMANAADEVTEYIWIDTPKTF
ncbi:MAG: cupin domain-containing protein [Acidobacteria bacterium]|nr:MAG: cupin domain-containing protein [Acidobacteriota bacterium]